MSVGRESLEETLERRWQTVLADLQDPELHRGFIRLAVLSGESQAAIVRYEGLAKERPELAPLIDAKKRELAMQLAAKLMQETAQRESELRVAMRARFERRIWAGVFALCGLIVYAVSRGAPGAMLLLPLAFGIALLIRRVRGR